MTNMEYKSLREIIIGAVSIWDSSWNYQLRSQKKNPTSLGTDVGDWRWSNGASLEQFFLSAFYHNSDFFLHLLKIFSYINYIFQHLVPLTEEFTRRKVAVLNSLVCRGSLGCPYLKLPVTRMSWQKRRRLWLQWFLCLTCWRAGEHYSVSVNRSAAEAAMGHREQQPQNEKLQSEMSRRLSVGVLWYAHGGYLLNWLKR